MADFIPSSDADFDAWLQNFVDYVVANAAALGSLVHGAIRAMKIPNRDRRKAFFKKCDARPEYASRISEQRNLS